MSTLCVLSKFFYSKRIEQVFYSIRNRFSIPKDNRTVVILGLSLGCQDCVHNDIAQKMDKHVRPISFDDLPLVFSVLMRSSRTIRSEHLVYQQFSSNHRSACTMSGGPSKTLTQECHTYHAHISTAIVASTRPTAGCLTLTLLPAEACASI